ncbi:MAG: hypothetical protein FWD68_04140 [Alphaproteobacteria bacterium]|nr:hypothetical protein [Alphaproteobacteria bacterium]
MPILKSPDKLAGSLLSLGDTVIEPSAWPHVMEQLCEAVGALGAGLLQTDVRTPDIPRTPSVDRVVDR